MLSATVIAVASDSGHNFSKPVCDSITLVEGLGVEGDAHLGVTVQHLHDMRKNPDAPNLRQVHLMHAELFDQLAGKGITVQPGQMGENITTRGIDLLGLSQGTRLQFPSGAEIEITGLRFPCSKLNAIHPELLESVIDRSRKAGKRPYPLSGIMGVISRGGEITAGEGIVILPPDTPHIALLPV